MKNPQSVILASTRDLVDAANSIDGCVRCWEVNEAHSLLIKDITFGIYANGWIMSRAAMLDILRRIHPASAALLVEIDDPLTMIQVYNSMVSYAARVLPSVVNGLKLVCETDSLEVLGVYSDSQPILSAACLARGIVAGLEVGAGELIFDHGVWTPPLGLKVLSLHPTPVNVDGHEWRFGMQTQCRPRLSSRVKLFSLLQVDREDNIVSAPWTTSAATSAGEVRIGYMYKSLWSRIAPIIGCDLTVTVDSSSALAYRLRIGRGIARNKVVARVTELLCGQRLTLEEEWSEMLHISRQDPQVRPYLVKLLLNAARL